MTHRSSILGRLNARTSDHRRPERESGQAMLVVLAAIALLATVPIAMVATVSGEMPLATHDVYLSTALEAAEAGLNDYLEQLAINPDYIVYSATNPPPGGNSAFTQWVAVPGVSTTPSEWFRYTPDTSQTAQTGIVTLVASGRAGTGPQAVVRTIEVGLRRIGFLDYVYFTNYETADPASYADPTTAQQDCEYHVYDPNPVTGGTGPDPSYCTMIVFSTGDVLTGPVHSNDGFHMCGSPNFESVVNSSDPTAPRWSAVSGCTGSPTFARAGDPAYQSVLALPTTDGTLTSYVTPGQPGAGCLYTGPTTISLHDNGTMDVSSPATKVTNADCVGTGVPLPANGLIYVQNIPASPSDPNYSKTCPAQNPISGYNCFNGDAIIRNANGATGGLKGQLTVAAADDVVIDGNLTYAGGLTGNDVLGLIANNDVVINHPVSNGANASLCGSTFGPTCDLENPVVDAAILTLAHSFTVMNYATGSALGTLTVNGSIAQDFRGPVGTERSGTQVSGYTKDYGYDGRLAYLSPPYYLTPVGSYWHPVSYAEVQAAYAPVS